MPRPEKQLDADASPRFWFGHEARYRRKRRGCTGTSGVEPPRAGGGMSLPEAEHEGQGRGRRGARSLPPGIALPWTESTSRISSASAAGRAAAAYPHPGRGLHAAVDDQVDLDGDGGEYLLQLLVQGRGVGRPLGQ